MTHVQEHLLDYPLMRSCPFDPSPEYARLRAEQPVARATLYGRPAWLITRYDDVRQALSDQRLSADIAHPDWPQSPAGEINKALDSGLPSFLRMDPPRHDEVRRLVTRDFMIKRVEAMRPRIQQLVDDHIDTMLAGDKPADLVEALASPVPSTVICWLLGVPQEDHAFFQDRSTYLFRRGVPDDVRLQKITELNDFMYELVDMKTADPGDDIVSRLAVEQLRPGHMDRRSLQGLAFILLVAGHETTGNMIALGTLALLQHPEQLAELRADPSLAPAVVEEMLRYLTILDDPNWRFALEDLEIGGQLIKKGEAVIPVTMSANRDESHYTDPDAFDIHRGARDHLAFGFGIHQCLGQPLARVELQVVYESLARRIPTLQLAVPLEEVPYKTDVDIFGVHALPVTW